MINFIADIDSYFEKLKRTIDNVDRNEINTFINLLLKVRDEGRHIFIMGNGGSAATASHSVCDFNKGVSYGKDRRFKFLCLNDSMATVSAYSNDVAYEVAFLEQLKNFVEPGDLVIGISGSGNSKNILLAIDYANAIGAVTVGITGYDGGKLKRNAQYSVNANINDMQISEDVHMILNHLCIKIISTMRELQDEE